MDARYYSGMQNPATATSLAAIDRKRTIFDQQLDQYATGETVHLVANLKATYLLAIGLCRKGGYQDSFSLIRESEAEIIAFLKNARSRTALFI